MPSTTDNAPVKEFRAGTIRAAIWRQKDGKDGSETARHTVKIEKRFRDKDGVWRSTSCLFADDLPRIVLVATKAFEYIKLRSSDESKHGALHD